MNLHKEILLSEIEYRTKRWMVWPLSSTGGKENNCYFMYYHTHINFQTNLINYKILFISVNLTAGLFTVSLFIVLGVRGIWGQGGGEPSALL